MVRLQYDGVTVWVNARNVSFIRPHPNGGSTVYMTLSGMYFQSDLSAATLSAMVSAAQGGAK